MNTPIWLVSLRAFNVLKTRRIIYRAHNPPIDVNPSVSRSVYLQKQHLQDNHETTAGQPRNSRRTTSGTPRDSHGTTTGQTAEQP
eukprot:2239973-Pyramimonas_sp.AAC.1